MLVDTTGKIFSEKVLRHVIKEHIVCFLTWTTDSLSPQNSLSILKIRNGILSWLEASSFASSFLVVIPEPLSLYVSCHDF